MQVLVLDSLQRRDHARLKINLIAWRTAVTAGFSGSSRTGVSKIAQWVRTIKSAETLVPERDASALVLVEDSRGIITTRMR